ncbi:MAG: hypothetical protein QF743_06275 [Candidatus Marinimicrobia bacterium]|jgi:hypothetical protein|nr:hypothetical protein [Candidatus Neomarinimicrobiota bacterium]MDP6612058.1 hypothetical protein [Candidatus Neomarinimicrobiota bacterium]|tara:strand:- start:3917 stop:4090 length:174 start_codon:yes stop_codon:yes gene_type:complete
MIRILIFGALAYLVFTLFKKAKLISKPNQKSVKGKNSYKNLDIKDADFEDLEQKEDK